MNVVVREPSAAMNPAVTAGTDPGAAGCCVCGAPARVRILFDYHDGSPVLEKFCLTCADGAVARYIQSAGDGGARRDWVARFCLLAGAAVCVLAAMGDYLNIPGSDGFGWQQRTGIVAGIVLVVLAAMLRIDILAVGGLVLLGLSALADAIHVGQSAGFGWKQEGCVLAAILLIAIGLCLRRGAAKPPACDVTT